MKPSSIACFIEYRSKASFFPSVFNEPNSWSVVGFGVAVKAIIDTLGCLPLLLISSSMRSAMLLSSSSRSSDRTYVTDSIITPAVDECASSMITAKVLSFSSFTKSKIFLNLWIVDTIIFVLPFNASAKSLEVQSSSRAFIKPALCSIDNTAFWSCRSTTLRSVIMQIVSNMT